MAGDVKKAIVADVSLLASNVSTKLYDMMKTHSNADPVTENTDLVRRLIDEVINERRYHVLTELVHDGYAYRSPETELHGAEALKDLFEGYRVAFPDLRVDIDHSFGNDQHVATVFTLTGTHEGPLYDLPATGRSVSVSGVVHSRIADGKIAEEWELIDSASLMHQLTVEG